MKAYVKLFFAVSVAWLSVVLTGQAEAEGPFTILPDAPLSLEVVRLRTTFSGLTVCSVGLVSMNASKITVPFSCEVIFGIVPQTSIDVDLGRFPAGTYTVDVVNASTGQTAYTTTFTVAEQHTIPPNNFPRVDYTDHWWNPLESGWGMSIHQHPSDRLFAIWFVYNQAGEPIWYTLRPGQWTSPVTYTGPIYRTAGPYFGGPFDPTQVSVTQVGTGTLTFPDSATGTFSYIVEGVSNSRPITRFPF